MKINFSTIKQDLNSDFAVRNLCLFALGFNADQVSLMNILAGK